MVLSPTLRCDPLDYALNEGEELEAALAAERVKYPRVTIELVDEVGPSGYPAVTVTGADQNVKRVLRDWGYGIERRPGVPTSTRYEGVRFHLV